MGVGRRGLGFARSHFDKRLRFVGFALVGRRSVLSTVFFSYKPSALDTLMPCLVSEGGYSYMAARICAFLAS